MRAVDETLVDTVYVDILRCGILKINRVNESGDPFVLTHAGGGGHILYAGMMRCLIQTDGLFGLKEPGPARDTDGL